MIFHRKKGPRHSNNSLHDLSCYDRKQKYMIWVIKQKRSIREDQTYRIHMLFDHKKDIREQPRSCVDWVWIPFVLNLQAWHIVTDRGTNDLIYLDMSVIEKDRGSPTGIPRLLSMNWQSRKYKSSFDFIRICQSSKKIDEALRAFVDFYRWIDNPEKIKPRLYTMANDWNIRTNRNIRIQYNTNHGYPYNNPWHWMPRPVSG